MPDARWVLTTAWQKVFPDPNKISPDRNRVARLTETHVKDSSRLREELDRLDMQSLNPEERELWYRVRGTLEYRAGNREEALQFYEQGLDLFPSSPVLMFACGQEYEYRGEIGKAFAMFRRVDLQSAGSRYTLEISRYFYLWNLIDEADRAIQWIFNAYYELQEADDNFLFIRNLPFYSTTFGYRATFAFLRRQPELAREELQKSARDLSSYDFEELGEELEAAIAEDWSRVISRIEAKLGRLSSSRGIGYLAMKRAALKSLSARSAPDAYSILDSVKLDEHDYPWLEDVRAICKARAAHQFSRPDEERQILGTFLERQPRLFEPNNAFDFGLIRYQEVLKSAYRVQRTRSLTSQGA